MICVLHVIIIITVIYLLHINKCESIILSILILYKCWRPFFIMVAIFATGRISGALTFKNHKISILSMLNANLLFKKNGVMYNINSFIQVMAAILKNGRHFYYRWNQRCPHF